MTTTEEGIRYGVSLYSYTSEFAATMTLDDCIDDVADMGATGLEILGETHVEDYPNPSTAWVDEWFARLDRLQLVPTCMGSWVDHLRFPGREMTEDEAVEQLETDIRLASLLGFRYLRPKLGVINHDLDPAPLWEPATERVLDLAAEKNIIICPEIHAPSVIKSRVVDDYISFIERTGTENFAILMDTGVFQTSHHHRTGGGDLNLSAFAGQPRPEPPAPVPVSDLRDVLKYVVHIQAKFYEITDALTDEYIPWAQILPVLKEAGWSGYLSSEYEGQYGVGRASDQLRRQHALIRTVLAEGGEL